MQRIFTLIIAFFTLIIISATVVLAAEVKITPKDPDENTPSVNIVFSGLVPNKEYAICRTSTRVDCRQDTNNTYINEIKANAAGVISFTACGDGDKFKFNDCGDGDYFHGAKTYKAYLFDRNGSNTVTDWKRIDPPAQVLVKHVYPDAGVASPDNKPKPGDLISITVCPPNRRPANNSDRNKIDFDLNPAGSGIDPPDPADVVIPNGGCVFRDFTAPEAGTYNLDIKWNDDQFSIYRYVINVDPKGGEIGKQLKDPTGKEGGTKLGSPGKNPCDINTTTGEGECDTALGKISTDPRDFANRILTISVGVAGGIAFIIMVIGAIRVLTSSGDQQKLSGGRDMIVAALAGLLFLIFSVLILRFIGISILKLS